MTQTSTEHDIAAQLASLGDRVRLRTLRLLEREELSVGEVASVLQMPQSTASRHLKALGAHGWLTKRSAGTATLYALVLDDLAEPARTLWVTARDALPRTPEIEQDDERLRSVLSSRTADSQAFFGRIAGDCDSLRRDLFGDRFTARSLVGLTPRTWVVADLGCGTGNVAELLGWAAERVIAVDRVDAMLSAAEKRLGGLSNVELRRGELERVPIADASVDAAVCSLVLHHCADPEAVVGEMARILRPDRGGGVALVVDMLAHDRQEYRRHMGHEHLGFSRDEVSELLGSAGLRDVVVESVPMERETKGPGLFVARGWVAA